jgi:hypothetical protein
MKVKIPRSYRSRLKEVGKNNGFKGWEPFAEHLIEKGLTAYSADASLPVQEQLESVVDEMGYSSREELIEHLLERGIDAYTRDEAEDQSQFEARLRGLGYIE